MTDVLSVRLAPDCILHATVLLYPILAARSARITVVGHGRIIPNRTKHAIVHFRGRCLFHRKALIAPVPDSSLTSLPLVHGV